MYKFGLGIVLAVITHASWAQSRPSSLSGTVSDAQHLAVPQVSIDLMSGDGQTLRTGATISSKEWRQGAIRSGSGTRGSRWSCARRRSQRRWLRNCR